MSDLTMSPVESGAKRTVEAGLAEELVARARAEGVELVGRGGLLTDLTKTALEVELEDHLGYAKHAAEGRDRATRVTGRGRRRC